MVKNDNSDDDAGYGSAIYPKVLNKKIFDLFLESESKKQSTHISHDDGLDILLKQLPNYNRLKTVAESISAL